MTSAEIDTAAASGELTDQQALRLLEALDSVPAEDTELAEVKETLVCEIGGLLSDYGKLDMPMLKDIQLPTSVIELAAEAAAAVIMAFERGYRME